MGEVSGKEEERGGTYEVDERDGEENGERDGEGCGDEEVDGSREGVGARAEEKREDEPGAAFGLGFLAGRSERRDGLEGFD